MSWDNEISKEIVGNIKQFKEARKANYPIFLEINIFCCEDILVFYYARGSQILVWVVLSVGTYTFLMHKNGTAQITMKNYSTIQIIEGSY